MKINATIRTGAGQGKTTTMLRLSALESNVRNVYYITDEYTRDFIFAKLENDETLNGNYNKFNITYIETNELVNYFSDRDIDHEYSLFDDSISPYTSEETRMLNSLYNDDNCKGLYRSQQLIRDLAEPYMSNKK